MHAAVFNPNPNPNPDLNQGAARGGLQVLRVRLHDECRVGVQKLLIVALGKLTSHNTQQDTGLGAWSRKAVKTKSPKCYGFY